MSAWKVRKRRTNIRQHTPIATLHRRRNKATRRVLDSSYRRAYDANNNNNNNNNNDENNEADGINHEITDDIPSTPPRNDAGGVDNNDCDDTAAADDQIFLPHYGNDVHDTDVVVDDNDADLADKFLADKVVGDNDVYTDVNGGDFNEALLHQIIYLCFTKSMKSSFNACGRAAAWTVSHWLPDK